MWVWVAMRCFFDADCTSSILMAAAFCALSLVSRLSRRNNEAEGSGEKCEAKLGQRT
jgi:hypothetical protein